MHQLIMKDVVMILSGDWNTNFLQEIVKLNELKNLYLTFNLINTVKSPTGSMKVHCYA